MFSDQPQIHTLPTRRSSDLDVWRTRVPWVCSTPLGSAVEPEVCTMMARSAGDTSPSTAASTCGDTCWVRSEEHTSELQSRLQRVCRRLLETNYDTTFAWKIR